ncbi:cyclin-domain-containing protein [Acrodontium crateriforme]|uniref:Cyclin-domain-containing protein n=1 Tax=Acrodontium crateriforme TaxID=150365 RepID=A0AAQ3M8B8_9PEZI|nr:cyclin-domain-containing protein [Acrodontium crateriforme]
MGSVVIDTGNSFFSQAPSHPDFAYHDAPHTHSSTAHFERRQSQTPSRVEVPMSSSTPRAPSSTNTHNVRESTATHQTPRSLSQSQQPHIPPQPPSPPLAAQNDAHDGSINAPTPAAGPAATDTRRSRPRKIKVRDLEHIQSFATENMSAFSEIRSRSRSGFEEDSVQYEISGMKVEDIIEMVAGLLTKITTTNDEQHEHLHRQPAHLDGSAHLDAQTSSVLAFHGKNVPSITILSYLSRVNKYCPTSYEVFLSLLVYFDRMTERVNAGPMQSLRQASRQTFDSSQSSSSSADSSSDSLGSDRMEGVTATTPQGTQQATPPLSGHLERKDLRGVPGTPHSKPHSQSPSMPPEPSSMEGYNLSHFFVVDSFNIHRLVIAGVTCASKFFSDIFYTNSRYAKVGGLPLPELNHLELQFLLLNDFRLSVPVEEIEAYGTMLVEFYAREVVAQRRADDAMSARSMSESSTESTVTVRAAT